MESIRWIWHQRATEMIVGCLDNQRGTEQIPKMQKQCMWHPMDSGIGIVPHHWMGIVKYKADKGEYKHFKVLPFFEKYTSATLFHHVTMCAYVYSIHHYTILVSPFHNTNMNVFLLRHLTISPFRPVNLCVFYAPLYPICFTIVPY